MKSLFEKISETVNEIDKDKISKNISDITDKIKQEIKEVNKEEIWDKAKVSSQEVYNNSKLQIGIAKKQYEKIQENITGKSKIEREKEKKIAKEIARKKKEEQYKSFIRKLKIFTFSVLSIFVGGIILILYLAKDLPRNTSVDYSSPLNGSGKTPITKETYDRSTYGGHCKYETRNNGDYDYCLQKMGRGGVYMARDYQ
jgi:hypothetical protein